MLTRLTSTFTRTRNTNIQNLVSDSIKSKFPVPNRTTIHAPPNSFLYNYNSRKNHTSTSTSTFDSPGPRVEETTYEIDIHNTMSSSTNPLTTAGQKRSLPAEEGAGPSSSTTSVPDVQLEQAKRARLDAADVLVNDSGSRDKMVVDSTTITASGNPSHPGAPSNPAEAQEGRESDSDVIITGDGQNAKGKGQQRPKGKGKGPPRRPDNWKAQEKANKRSRGRAPPTSGPGRTRNEEDALKKELGEDGAEGEEKEKSIRYPKRPCALLLGFCGSGYSGMQIQPDHTRTIEGVLFNALVRAGAVSQDNADNPTKVGLARAARTDAGVHAAGNVVSLKLITKRPGLRDLVERINEELPPEIRVWGYARTQNSFNARLICESRKYTYFFPTYLLIPPKPGSGMHRIWSELVSTSSTTEISSETMDTTTTTSAPPAPSISYEFWSSQPAEEESTKDEDLARKRAWRIAPAQVSTLREAAAQYIGTHNFHNFTVGRDFDDRSSKRYMRKIEVGDPVVYGETEWISVMFHGQSFMLHQRKMMAALVLSCRMGTPTKVINELYKEPGVFVPKMPSLGLLLEEPLFDSYNQRMSAINAKLDSPSHPEYRPLIDFDAHREKIDAFKEEFIYQNMRKVEDRDGLFDAWIRYMDAYAGNDLMYLNPSGVIPDACVIKRGEKRPNPFKEKRVFDTTSFPAKGIKQILEGVMEADADADVEGSDEEEEVIDKRHLAETEG